MSSKIWQSRWLRVFGVILILSLVASTLLTQYARWIWVPLYQKVFGKQTVQEVVAYYEKEVDLKLLPYLTRVGLPYPPQKVTLLAFKQERTLELWGSDGQQWKLIKKYPFTATSGILGPKLKNGDRQIPEGIYEIEGLNPNSSYHLSLKVNYPNEFDQKMAQLDNRTDLGGDIFIHGKASSIGCIPVGDEAIEEIFTLVYKVGRENVKVIIAPTDMRKVGWQIPQASATWIDALYQNLKGELQHYQNSDKSLMGKIGFPPARE